MSVEKWATPGSLTTVLSTELNSLASGSQSAVSGSVYDNTTAGDRFAIAEAHVTFGTAPVAGTVLDLYCFPSLDGTNYPDGGGSTIPSGYLYVGSFEVENVNTAQRLQTPIFELPGPFKMVFSVYNRTDQAMASSGNTVKVIPFDRQST